MCNQMAATCEGGVPHVHAMAHDASTGELLALGLNASDLKPFVFTVDTAAFEARVVARFEACSRVAAVVRAHHLLAAPLAARLSAALAVPARAWWLATDSPARV